MCNSPSHEFESTHIHTHTVDSLTLSSGFGAVNTHHATVSLVCTHGGNRDNRKETENVLSVRKEKSQIAKPLSL